MKIMKLFLIILSTFVHIQAGMPFDAKIYVAGHTGLVGSAIVRRLKSLGYTNIITRTSKELDLCRQEDVETFFANERPEYVFLAAAKVGGIVANRDYPADFIFRNLAIELNVINSSYKYGVKKLLFLGTSCIYPRDCPQPIKEEYLLSGGLEKTNEAYAIAKIAGISLCQSYNRQLGTNFIACMPTNLYGPGDNFNLTMSHVLPALLSKMICAKETNAENVVIWGTGKVYREFLYVDDCADACVFLMNNYTGDEVVNVGTGQELTIGQLAEKIKKAVGFEGELVYDNTKPDGTPRKLLNVDRINALGWKASTSLEEGIAKTIAWYHQTNHIKE